MRPDFQPHTVTSELLPCPFCGEKLVEQSDHHGTWISHRNEPADCECGTTQIHDERDAARWNQRPEASSEAGAVWRPVDSAPKDGSWFLAFDEPRQVVARWCEKWKDFRDESFEEVDPTHWMPLPEPPQARAGEGGES